MPPILTIGPAHGVLQSAGLVTTTLVEQVPLVAVIVTLLAIGILIILLPLTVPALVVIVAPAVAV